MAPPLELYNSPITPIHSDHSPIHSDQFRSLRSLSDHSPIHSDHSPIHSDQFRSVPITTPPSSLTTLFAHTLTDTTLLQEAILLRLK